MTTKRRSTFREANIAQHAAMYESVAPEILNSWFESYLPLDSGNILDVGAGSCRDAAWLASKGHQVVALEPSSSMRKQVERFHSSGSFKLIDDQLPDLNISRSGMSFDLILLNAVWMFIPQRERARSFRKLIALLKPRGILVFTLRMPCESERGMHPVSVDEIEQFAKAHGAFIEKVNNTVPDHIGRPHVSWSQIIVRLPDDGTGALPLIRRIVLLDDKSSTYKLALLRSLSRVASIFPGFAHEYGDDHVKIPMGAVALCWIQLYLPLLKANMPQSSINDFGGHRLGFAKSALDNLIVGSHEINALRPGVSLYKEFATDFTQALRDATAIIQRMPVKYIYYPDGSPIFKVNKHQFRIGESIILDEDYFSKFGEMIVPAHLWKAFLRYNIWIEPALVEEWSRLILRYAKKQNRSIEELRLKNLMRPYEPERNQSEVRSRALRLLNSQPVYCVWTGEKLRSNNIHIDHCLPWAAWPCDDLWNLMPAKKNSNLSKKDYLPNHITIREAQDRIMTWWERAYCGDHATSERFILEAKARLPALKDLNPQLDDIFFALDLQRMRLYSDHRIPEWSGPKKVESSDATLSSDDSNSFYEI